MADHSILIVEDEHTLRRLLEYRLGKHYRVRTAANGEEALVRVADEAPDLIVSDIMMPRMDGFALQAALQEKKDTRAIPFIFLTAKADEQSRQRGRRRRRPCRTSRPRARGCRGRRSAPSACS